MLLKILSISRLFLVYFITIIQLSISLIKSFLLFSPLRPLISSIYIKKEYNSFLYITFLFFIHKFPVAIKAVPGTLQIEDSSSVVFCTLFSVIIIHSLTLFVLSCFILSCQVRSNLSRHGFTCLSTGL